MYFIRKVFLYFKSIFNKKEEVKKIDAPKDTVNEKEKFIENLKVTTTYKRPRKKAETFICDGNGLGIQSEVKF